MDETGFEYKAEMGKTVILTTIFSLAVMGGIAVYLCWFTEKSPVPVWPGILISALVFVIVVITYLYSPKAYVITPAALLIKRPWKDIVIELSKIKKAEAITKDKLKYSFRLFGSGGLFGFFGLFTNRELGKYTASYTDFHKLVLIKADKTYVISPSDREEFLSVLSGKMRK